MPELFLLIILIPALLFLLLAFPVWTLILLHTIRKRQDDTAKLLEAVRQLRLDLPRPREPVESRPAPSPLTVNAAPPSIPQPPRPPPMPMPVPRPPVATPPPVAASAVETAAVKLLRKAWNWLIVGEEFRRKDLPIEYAIATNWLVRIGILAVVLAAGFALKLSNLDSQSRVVLTLAAGAVMVGSGVHLFGKRYHLLGQGLAGGGIAVLYFAMFAAGSLFQIAPLTVAFGGMILVTVTSGALAVRFHSLLIAILGTLGGYLTPVLLQSGDPRLPVLYAYLLLLGLGLLGVSWKRQWPMLVWLAFLAHSLLVGVSLVRAYTPADFPIVMPFLAAFYLLFSTAIVLYNVATRTRSSLLELLGLLLAATLFFAFGYGIILATWPDRHAFAAGLSLGLCANAILHAAALQKWRHPDKPLETLFLGIGAVFLAVTPPLVFSRGWLTVTWAMEALVLLWMGLRLPSGILRLLAGVVYLLVIGRVATCDLAFHFRSAPLPVSGRAYLAVLGPRLLQFGLPILSLAGAWRLLQNSPAPERARIRFAGAPLAVLYALLFLYLNVELRALFGWAFAPLVRPSMTLAWVGLGFALLLHRQRLGETRLAALWILLLAALVAKLLLLDLPDWKPALTPLRYGVPCTAGWTLVRLLDFSLVAAFTLASFRLLSPTPSLRKIGLAAGWFTLAWTLAYLTLEVATALHRFLPAFRDGGVSLLWILFGLGLLTGGLFRRAASLRLAGLALFAAATGKIFLMDLARLPPLYRVIAFLAMGLALLLASSLYLKHKDRVRPPS